jgi:hypothetical protein
MKNVRMVPAWTVVYHGLTKPLTLKPHQGRRGYDDPDLVSGMGAEEARKVMQEHCTCLCEGTYLRAVSFADDPSRIEKTDRWPVDSNRSSCTSVNLTSVN